MVLFLSFSFLADSLLLWRRGKWGSHLFHGSLLYAGPLSSYCGGPDPLEPLVREPTEAFLLREVPQSPDISVKTLIERLYGNETLPLECFHHSGSSEIPLMTLTDGSGGHFFFTSAEVRTRIQSKYFLKFLNWSPSLWSYLVTHLMTLQYSCRWSFCTFWYWF